jgi:hypothetical protein
MSGRSRLCWALFGCLSVLGGCSDAFDASEERALEQAQARWNDAGLLDYQVEVRLSCFCQAALPVFSRLDVRAGQVVAAEPLSPTPGAEDIPWTPGRPWRTCLTSSRAPHTSRTTPRLGRSTIPLSATRTGSNSDAKRTCSIVARPTSCEISLRWQALRNLGSAAAASLTVLHLATKKPWADRSRVHGPGAAERPDARVRRGRFRPPGHD